MITQTHPKRDRRVLEKGSLAVHAATMKPRCPFWTWDLSNYLEQQMLLRKRITGLKGSAVERRESSSAHQCKSNPCVVWPELLWVLGRVAKPMQKIQCRILLFIQGKINFISK